MRTLDRIIAWWWRGKSWVDTSTIRRRKPLLDGRRIISLGEENISIVYDELTFILFFARHGATAAIPSEFRGSDAFAAMETERMQNEWGKRGDERLSLSNKTSYAS